MRGIKRNVKALRAIGITIDIANVVFSVLIIVLGILIVINTTKFAKTFPILFLAAFFVNLLLGLKCSLREEKSRARVQYFIAGILLIISLSGYIGLWR